MMACGGGTGQRGDPPLRQDEEVVGVVAQPELLLVMVMVMVVVMVVVMR